MTAVIIFIQESAGGNVTLRINGANPPNCVPTEREKEYTLALSKFLADEAPKLAVEKLGALHAKTTRIGVS